MAPGFAATDATDVVDAAAVSAVPDCVGVAGTADIGYGLATAHIAVASVGPGEHILADRKDGWETYGAQ